MFRALLEAEGVLSRAATTCSPGLWLCNYSSAGTMSLSSGTLCAPTEHPAHLCVSLRALVKGHKRPLCSSHPSVVSAIADESVPQAVIVPQDLIVTKNEEAMFDCQFAAVPPPTQEWLFEDSPVTNRSK